MPQLDVSTEFPALLSLIQVKKITTLSAATIYRKMAETPPSFPKSIHIGNHRRAWLASDIENWLNERITESKAAIE